MWWWGGGGIQSQWAKNKTCHVVIATMNTPNVLFMINYSKAPTHQKLVLQQSLHNISVLL